MKRTILILAGLAAIGGLGIYYTTQHAPQAAPAVAEPAADAVTTEAPKPKPAHMAQHEPRPESTASNQASSAPPPGSVEAIAFMANIDKLVSPHGSFAEKQAIWKQLTDSGRLADAAAELEKLMASDPSNAMYPAELGQAYLKLCATTTDIRAQAVWAMNADMDFDTALNLDPSNWEARFTKAVAMTYWPENLNKGPEVIDQFNTLIAQQEQQPPQPQYAAAYEWLGKQYQKTGQTASAQQVWQRGAALYPDNQRLQNLLAASASAQQ
jgi:tetratricopeptide (TPR) repeat protein